MMLSGGVNATSARPLVHKPMQCALILDYHYTFRSDISPTDSGKDSLPFQPFSYFWPFTTQKTCFKMAQSIFKVFSPWTVPWSSFLVPQCNANFHTEILLPAGGSLNKLLFSGLEPINISEFSSSDQYSWNDFYRP